MGICYNHHKHVALSNVVKVPAIRATASTKAVWKKKRIECAKKRLEQKKKKEKEAEKAKPNTCPKCRWISKSKDDRFCPKCGIKLGK